MAELNLDLLSGRRHGNRVTRTSARRARLLGLTWELAQTTVVGHNARLADLAPNLTSGLVCLAAVAALRQILEKRKQRFADGQFAGSGVFAGDDQNAR